MLMDAPAYRVQLSRKPLPLILGTGVHPIHVDVDVQVTDAGKVQTFAAHLKKGQPNEWRFTVDQ